MPLCLIPMETLSPPYEFWRRLDLTVMPAGDMDLIPSPTLVEVGDYLEAFCRQFDYGIGSAATLVRLLEKPETVPAMKLAGDGFLDNSPAYQTLRLLSGLGCVQIKPASPWVPELPWMKQDRLEGRPPDHSWV